MPHETHGVVAVVIGKDEDNVSWFGTGNGNGFHLVGDRNDIRARFGGNADSGKKQG